jgi:hypothetical protein
VFIRLAAVGIRAEALEPAVAAGVPESFGTLDPGLHTIWLFQEGIYLALSEICFALTPEKSLKLLLQCGDAHGRAKSPGSRF